MKTQPKNFRLIDAGFCPRCDYRLVPVFALERGVRRVIGLSCPEPYCDHMQMVTRDEAKRLAAAGTPVCINVILKASDFREGSISI